MLNRKRKTKDPCPGCFLHKALCICEFTPRLNLRTRVSLLVHAKELKRTTNTGRLAIRCLVNSEMHIRGLVDKAVDLSSMANEKYRNLLFFPSKTAIELGEAMKCSDPRPVRLIVPDGNWRQASKVPYRHKELENIPHVKISEPNAATSHLRTEHMIEGMATLEAIAHALRIVESESVFKKLMEFYNLKLQRTMTARPKERPTSDEVGPQPRSVINIPKDFSSRLRSRTR